jgi:hypothetical protein
MTNKEYEQKMENGLEVLEKAMAEMRETVKSINTSMEGRTARTIKRMFEMFDDPKDAVKEIISLGYTKDDIQEAGYEVE